MSRTNSYLVSERRAYAAASRSACSHKMSPMTRPFALIVISHGTAARAACYYDTAMALTDAGFVVAALSQLGDDYKHHSLSFSRRNFAERPRQAGQSCSIPGNGHDHLYRARMFGHSCRDATTRIGSRSAPTQISAWRRGSAKTIPRRGIAHRLRRMRRLLRARRDTTV